MYTRVGSQDLRLGSKCLGFEVCSSGRVPSLDLNVWSKCSGSKVVSQGSIQRLILIIWPQVLDLRQGLKVVSLCLVQIAS